MDRLPAVEEARALFTIARDWSIVKWLAEKRRVREIADRGTAALDELEKQVKSTWSDDLRNAYADCADPSDSGDDPFAAAEREFATGQSLSIGAGIRTAARRVRDADDVAYAARMAAERTFDQAEWRLSAGLARRGADEAIRAYDLRYKAIAEAEAARAAR
jgi:hypothetical protein